MSLEEKQIIQLMFLDQLEDYKVIFSLVMVMIQPSNSKIKKGKGGL